MVLTSERRLVGSLGFAKHETDCESNDCVRAIVRVATLRAYQRVTFLYDDLWQQSSCPVKEDLVIV